MHQYQILAENRKHDKATKLFQQYDACDRALKQLLVGAVDEMFIAALRDKHVGYAGTTTLDLLKHLYTTYGNITDYDLHKNQEILNDDFDPNLPIESYFRRVEDCVEFAAAAKCPFTPDQIVSRAFYTIQKSGFSPDDVKEWRRSPKEEKTWSNFKKHFKRAYQELRESSATTTTAGYAANNIQESTAQAIQNMANATMADRDTMSNLTATINTLTQQLAQTNLRLNESLALTAKLQADMQILKASGGKKTAAVARDKYCWTHGIKCGHSSKECNKKAAGHQDEATEEDKMGGRTTKWQSWRK